MIRVLLLAILITTSTACAQDSRGSICGTVRDENGAPAKFVVVVAFWGGSHSGPEDASRTDGEGHYCVRNLAFGSYTMSAEDHGKGYTDYENLYRETRTKTQWIKIDAAHPEATYDWRIPYKAALVHLRFIDEFTGLLIPNTHARVTLAAKSDPENRWISGGSMSNDWLIPPNEDIYLNITVVGYMNRPGDGSKGMVLNYPPGSTNTLVVPLRSISH